MSPPTIPAGLSWIPILTVVPTPIRGGAAAQVTGVAVNGTAGGTTYIAFGARLPAMGLPALTLPGGMVGDNDGLAAASAGDLDANGHADLVVSSDGSDRSGRVHVYRGGANWPSATPTQTLANPEGPTGAHFGRRTRASLLRSTLPAATEGRDLGEHAPA
jgi:hypothetical protein